MHNCKHWWVADRSISMPHSRPAAPDMSAASEALETHSCHHAHSVWVGTGRSDSLEQHPPVRIRVVVADSPVPGSVAVQPVVHVGGGVQGQADVVGGKAAGCLWQDRGSSACCLL